jgi:hypothetical protein
VRVKLVLPLPDLLTSLGVTPMATELAPEEFTVSV